ncbi:hypothetical protein EV203_10417 [Caldanaerobacter subterraneus]|uniref:Uncharacterized protein n=1 Tax=Caldanaerobacter subterraneus TaxID=911092 RepID=A0A4R2K5Y7_9THEO|nr:hypothetical protein EV203_10417 [Caldanaerobacter subterraneus]
MKNGIFLRINVGERKYVYAKVQAGWKKGLGLEKRVPDNYIKLLNTLTVEKLEELKEIKKAIEFIQSLESESERVLKPLYGTSFSAYDFWQVLKVAVVTPLSPEKVPRDFSVLKELLIQGKWGRPVEALVPASWGRG